MTACIAGAGMSGGGRHALQGVDRSWMSLVRAAVSHPPREHLTSLHMLVHSGRHSSHLVPFEATAPYSYHGRPRIWHLRCDLDSSRHWALYAIKTPKKRNQETNGDHSDMLFQGEGEAFNVGAFLESISPYAWASTGIGLCIGLSVIGAAWSVRTNTGSTKHEAKTRRWHIGESSSQEHLSSVEVSRHREFGQRI